MSRKRIHFGKVKVVGDAIEKSPPRGQPPKLRKKPSPK